jgi:hypothetical protein
MKLEQDARRVLGDGQFALRPPQRLDSWSPLLAGHVGLSSPHPINAISIDLC